MIESKPQNSIEELKARNIELTIQNQELQLANIAEIAAQKLNLFCVSPIGHYLTDCDGKIVELNRSGLALWTKQLMTY
jgi:hypothetical protein